MQHGPLDLQLLDVHGAKCGPRAIYEYEEVQALRERRQLVELTPIMLLHGGCAGSFGHPLSSCGRPLVVVEPAEHGDHCDRTRDLGLDGFAGHRNPLADPLMGSRRVEII